MDLCTHYATMHEYINNNIMRNCMKYDYEVLFEEGWLDNIGKGIGDTWKTASTWVKNNWKTAIKWIVKIFHLAVNWVLSGFKNRSAIYKASKGAMDYIKKLCNKAVEKATRHYKENNESFTGSFLSDWSTRLNIFAKNDNKSVHEDDDKLVKGKGSTTKITIKSINGAFNKIFTGMATPKFQIDVEKHFPTTANIKTLVQFKQWILDVKDFYEDNIFVSEPSFYNNLGALRSNVAKQLHYINEYFKLIKKIQEFNKDDDYGEMKESYDLFNVPDYYSIFTEENSNMRTEKEENAYKALKKKQDDGTELTESEKAELAKLEAKETYKKVEISGKYSKVVEKIKNALSKLQSDDKKLSYSITKKINGSPFESVCSAKCLEIVNNFLNEKTNLLAEKIKEVSEIMKENLASGKTFTFTVDTFKESEIKTDLKELGAGIDITEILKADNALTESKALNDALLGDFGLDMVAKDLKQTVELYNEFEAFYANSYWYFERRWSDFDDKNK